ncbi:tetratricopeptide repeat protein [Patescibacteria group bacterium]|nr:MAG: tetratricopeptide repeat protein [Patescibacteria group bacterium]
MIGLLIIAAAAFFLFRLLGGAPKLRLNPKAPAVANQNKIEELTDYARRLRAAGKYTAAEKVYMQILKIDHRHVQTYSRMGTLYSAQRNYPDAIEAFEMSTKLKPSGTTYYNLGLAFFENRNYMKAAAAFEKAVMFEPTLQRYIGLAKTFKKLDNNPRMIQALEQAVQLEASPRVLWLLADAYEASRQPAKAEAVRKQIATLDPSDERLRRQKPTRI